MFTQTRRDFLKKSSILGVWPLVNGWLPKSESSNLDKLKVNIFSKHLQFLDYQTLGEMTAKMGFDGIDLTVRPKGHVVPESVETDLPKAIEAIKRGGSNCKMITTQVEQVENERDVKVLEIASRLGVDFYRMNWYKYPKDKSMEDALGIYQKQIQALAELNKELGIIGCYQNHAGKKVGASYWEVKKILAAADSDYFGAQYDIRHAKAEAAFGWENGLQLLLPEIKTIVLKDFKWGKVKGKWKAINTPIGEGMVDFDRYFKLLKKAKLNPPVSLHLEYDLGGAEKGRSEILVDKKMVYEAMEKDLRKIRELWSEA